MTITQKLANLLVDKCSLTLGEDLFLGSLPNDRDEGYVLSIDDGSTNWSGFTEIPFYITVFHKNYVNCEENIFSIFSSLFFECKGQFSVGGDYLMVKPLGTPAYAGRTPDGRYVFVGEFLLSYSIR